MNIQPTTDIPSLSAPCVKKRGFRIFNIGTNTQNADSFIYSNQSEKELSTQIFKKTRKFSIRNYNKLSKEQLEVLRSYCENDMQAKEAAQDNLEIGLKLKEYLDNEYGEDKYVFVSIGRSPAGIARVMEFCGVQTKYLPISNLRNYEDEDCAYGAANGLREYGKYLHRQGITNEDIEFSDKKYLFFDFTDKGKSLRFVEKLIRKYYRVNKRNMQFRSLNAAIENAVKGDEYLKKRAELYIEKYLSKSGIESYCGIDALKVSELDRIGEQKKFESLTAKKYNFLIIDELQKRGLLKENKKNRHSL